MIAGLLLQVSCDRKAEAIQEEDSVSEQVLEGEQTPEQYQGSTGVEEDNNNMVANENIELEKQVFKGSFSSAKTQNYTFNVLDETKEYTFRIESGHPDVKYMVTEKGGSILQEATSGSTTLSLAPGEYNIMGVLDTDENVQTTENTEFTVYIE